jgi:hypothetical protein
VVLEVLAVLRPPQTQLRTNSDATDDHRRSDGASSSGSAPGFVSADVSSVVTSCAPGVSSALDAHRFDGSATAGASEENVNVQKGLSQQPVLISASASTLASTSTSMNLEEEDFAMFEDMDALVLGYYKEKDEEAARQEEETRRAIEVEVARAERAEFEKAVRYLCPLFGALEKLLGEQTKNARELRRMVLFCIARLAPMLVVCKLEGKVRIENMLS